MNCAPVKRSWAEVDLQQIRANFRAYKDSLPAGCRVMAVVKADAYGHGDVQVAKVLAQEGAADFAVSNIDEACRLRQAGIAGQILILGYTPAEEYRRLEENDITQALVSEEYAALLAEKQYKGKCQFALDTGMNRIGLDADDPDECARIIRKYSSLLDLTGLFTHLCVADTATEDAQAFTAGQIAKFEAVAGKVSDLSLPYVHCLNSAGGLWHKSEVSCFARLGIILYGLKPDYLNTLPSGIRPALTWKSVVAMVKTVHAGETIGYGRSFKAGRDMLIATIPTGYADGLNRMLSNRFYVLINGKKAPITGRVCMDQFMADVTGIDDIHIGTEVILLGSSGEETVTADDMAQCIGSIGYEVVCDISKRVPRVYINE